MTMMEARIVHVSIDRNWHDVYAFAADPQNMPLWASGLGSGVEADGQDWIARGPLGSVHVRFAPKNDFGVIDHVVRMDSGIEANNALRIVPNGDGAEVMFTVLKLPGVDDRQFAEDCTCVSKDLRTLKTLLER